MEILVTGGCGYIGSHVCLQLSRAGHRVLVVDDLSTGFKKSLISGELLYEGSCGDPALLKKIFSQHQIKAVLHFAASIKVPESVEKPLLYYRNNSVNTLELINASINAGVSYFIFSSTAAVYGNCKDGSASESTPLSPESPYARSKLMDEWMLEDLARVHSLRYVILRYFNVAGAQAEGLLGQRSPDASHLIKIACEVATQKRSELVVCGTDYQTIDGTGVRDYIHVDDLAAAHLSALKYLDNNGSSRTLNCGYGQGSSVLQVLSAFEKITGQKLAARMGARRQGDVAQVVADAREIRRVLDWSPRFEKLETIVADALAWEKKLRN